MAGQVTRLGPYELFHEIASGGMATIHLGCIRGPGGFARAVAIKQLHTERASEPERVATLLDEARLASRIRHPNVLTVLDVIVDGATTAIVADYVHGESLHHLLDAARARGDRVPPRIACAIAVAALRGLHAAHQATNEKGEPLDIVHRDVSPHNVMVDVDGVTRVVDFGIAKAIGRLQDTTDGSIKGKLPYMAPEQLKRRAVSRRVDIYAAAVVLWEVLVGRRLFDAPNQGALVARVLQASVPPPSSLAPIPAALDAIVAKATSRDPALRHATALEMAQEIEAAVTDLATPIEIGAWVQELAGETLEKRTALVRALEKAPPPADDVPTTTRPAAVAVAAPDRSRRAFAWTLAGSLVVIAGAAIAAIAAARAGSGAAPAKTPATEPPAPATTEPVPDAAPPEPVVEPATSASATVQHARPRPRPAASDPKPVGSCDPRRYIDDQGHIHYDATCFR